MLCLYLFIGLCDKVIYGNTLFFIAAFLLTIDFFCLLGYVVNGFCL